MTEKTFAEKVFVKKATAIAVFNADDRHAALLAQLPAALMAATNAAADLILLFANSQHELERLLPQAKARLLPKGALWVAYVKGTSAQKSDLHRDTIREYAETIGLTSVAIIAIDANWSALRLKL